MLCAELHVQHCNDFFSVGTGAWSAISCVRSLRRIAIEDLHCRLEADSLKELSSLCKVCTTVHALSSAVVKLSVLHSMSVIASYSIQCGHTRVIQLIQTEADGCMTAVLPVRHDK